MRISRVSGVAASVVALTAVSVGLSVQSASSTTTLTNSTPLLPADDSMVSSTITVSGHPNTLTDVNITLQGFSQNDEPSEMDILLEGPNGQKVMVMSDTGGDVSLVSGLTITIDDEAADPIPTPLISGTFKPTNIDDGDFNTVPSDESVDNAAFPVPTATTLSAFDGTNPNGVWTLFVASDECCADEGGLSAGWSLSVNPDPAVCAGLPVTILGTSSAETLAGTEGSDVIAAGGGDDRILGLGGNDVICGGDGNDTLKGGGGNDKLFGDAGRDKLRGGAGAKDLCKGGLNPDNAKKCEKVRSL
jgi:Ca2+-binding RTX toxin-like protein